ncbi:MAG: hypothetical protein P8Z68_12430, partial [Kineosporiaceae bacterium]
TADLAGQFPGVRVLTTPEASKAGALRLGDEAAGADFPRIYVDADVELGSADVHALVAALERPGVLAAAPAREIPRGGAPWTVRWYYDVWERLPAVRRGVFGRGVIALSAAGFTRVSALPAVLADDLAMSSTFTDTERVVVPDATVVVHPPRTWADLLRRRVRAVTGTAQVYTGDAAPTTDSRTRRGDLVDLLRREPGLAPKLAVFLVVTVIARRRAARVVARGDFTTWLRDDSSR